MAKRMVLLATIALLLPCLATAATATFTTTGTFSNPSLYPGLTFTGDTTPVVTPGGNVIFGTFNLTGCSPTCHGSETFTLTIDQSTPGIGTGNIDVTFKGTVTASSSGLNLTFKKAEVEIAGSTPVFYNITNHESINFGAPTTLNGHATVPEPAARLLLGLGMFGLMGLTLVSRRMLTT